MIFPPKQIFECYKDNYILYHKVIQSTNTENPVVFVHV